MRGLPLYNFPAFDRAAHTLREQGYAVVNPAEIDRLNGFHPEDLPPEHDWNSLPDGLSLSDIVERDLTALLGCTAIYLLPGWEQSKGAKAELAVAEWLGLNKLGAI